MVYLKKEQSFGIQWKNWTTEKRRKISWCSEKEQWDKMNDRMSEIDARVQELLLLKKQTKIRRSKSNFWSFCSVMIKEETPNRFWLLKNLEKVNPQIWKRDLTKSEMLVSFLKVLTKLLRNLMRMLSWTVCYCCDTALAKTSSSHNHSSSSASLVAEGEQSVKAIQQVLLSL